MEKLDKLYLIEEEPITLYHWSLMYKKLLHTNSLKNILMNELNDNTIYYVELKFKSKINLSKLLLYNKTINSLSIDRINSKSIEIYFKPKLFMLYAIYGVIGQVSLHINITFDTLYDFIYRLYYYYPNYKDITIHH
jgi:hypothetical protein